jgi:hypothetical protein
MTQSLRITIGGVEVDALGPAASRHDRVERPAPGSDDVTVMAHARSDSVTVAGEGSLSPACPIPPGPWRLVGLIAAVAVVFAIVAAIRARPR